MKHIIEDTAIKLSCTEKEVFTKAATFFQFGDLKGIYWFQTWCRNGTVPEVVNDWCMAQLAGGHDV